MNAMIERPQPADPATLVGSYRRFASGGPPYVILAMDAERQTCTIRVLESGEEFDCPIAKIADDEEA